MKATTWNCRIDWDALVAFTAFSDRFVSPFCQDICTEQTCPTMSAGSYSWQWADGDKVKADNGYRRAL